MKMSLNHATHPFRLQNLHLIHKREDVLAEVIVRGEVVGKYTEFYPGRSPDLP